jgi:hypothetical protein
MINQDSESLILLIYLSDIFLHLHYLNINLQGRRNSIILLVDKGYVFIKKCIIWIIRFENTKFLFIQFYFKLH